MIVVVAWLMFCSALVGFGVGGLVMMRSCGRSRLPAPMGEPFPLVRVDPEYDEPVPVVADPAFRDYLAGRGPGWLARRRERRG